MAIFGITLGLMPVAMTGKILPNWFSLEFYLIILMYSKLWFEL